MDNRPQKEAGPVVATIVGVTISLVIVLMIFFALNEINGFDGFLPRKKESINELLDKGRTEEAIKHITNASPEIQNSDTAMFMLGKAWYLSAWQRYDNENWKTYAKNPDDWFIGSDVDKSLHYLQRAAEAPNFFSEATTLIGVVYMEKGWYDKAKNTFAAVLKKDVTQRDAYLYYGVVLSREKHTVAAIRHLENWKNYPNDFDFLKNLFYLYLFEEKNYSKAVILGDMFLKIAPKGNRDVPKITRELHDLEQRFPEYFNNNMYIIKNRPPEFAPRKR